METHHPALAWVAPGLFESMPPAFRTVSDSKRILDVLTRVKKTDFRSRAQLSPTWLSPMRLFLQLQAMDC